jgi:hypothetical protein
VLGFPGSIVRIIPARTHRNGAGRGLRAALQQSEGAIKRYSPRGLDIDTNGVIWTPTSSGHFVSFDRRKCKGPLNGPTATGQHCPEGWTFYPFPAPQLKGVTDSGSAEASYYDWVDQFDTFGLGKNTPIATGNGEDALMALQNGQWVTLRVPYPLGFFAKGLDGRIDDARAGWKGKGLWSTYATRTPFHMERRDYQQGAEVPAPSRPVSALREVEAGYLPKTATISMTMGAQAGCAYPSRNRGCAAKKSATGAHNHRQRLHFPSHQAAGVRCDRVSFASRGFAGTRRIHVIPCIARGWK